MDYINDREKLIEILKKNLSEDRLRHSLSTEKRALQLAKIHGENEKKAGFAGLMHDVTKCFNNEKLAAQYGIKDYTSPKVLHQFTGSIYLENHGITDDEDILNAVKYHTTGRAGMSRLEKIIYLADLTEETRSFEGVEKMRNLSDKNLDKAMLSSLASTIILLAKQNLPIDELTLNAYNYFISQNKKENF